jgi:hypothetical protein
LYYLRQGRISPMRGHTTGVGGIVVTVGAAAAGILATVASTSEKTASDWHHSWFLALISLCGLVSLLGLYIVFAGIIDRLPPRSWSRSGSESANVQAPQLSQHGIGEFWDAVPGTSQPGEYDLNIVYAVIRNAQGAGDAVDAEISVNIFQIETESQIGPQTVGNWIDLSAGQPRRLPADQKKMTLRATERPYGVELGGKFLQSEMAYIPGESHPSLGPGTYRVVISVIDKDNQTTDFAWVLHNPGKDQSLRARLPEGAFPLPSLTPPYAALASASTAPDLDIRDTRDVQGSPLSEMSDRERLLREIDTAIQYMAGRIEYIGDGADTGEIEHSYRQLRRVILRESPRHAELLPPLENPISPGPESALRKEAEKLLARMDRVREAVRNEG